MDLSESTRLLLHRISEVDPDIASKAIGYLLLKDYGDREMIRLAFGPDSAIAALVDEVKSALPFINLSPRPPPPAAAAAAPNDTTTIPNHFNMHHLQPLSLPPPPASAPNDNTTVPNHFKLQRPQSLTLPDATSPVPPTPFHPRQQHPPFSDGDAAVPPPLLYTPTSTLDPRATYGGAHLFNLDDLNAYYPSSDAAAVLGQRTTRRSPSYAFSEPPPSPKACHYFYKGYCKHGLNCRYLHDHPAPAVGYYAFSNAAANDDDHDDHDFVPGSLEAEITDLLRARRGQPISIATLPLLYQETYNKVLQAEGYLTESQRHGKAGYNLTKLLARMKGSIRLIDRPHGQHSVILAEDAPRAWNDIGTGNAAVSTSHNQIYLTFPAESTFTEDDIATYFSHFGPVQAVRIPAQQKRMFGFVTFAHPEAVHLVFAKGNPHYICDARVLVKPYREKTRKSCDKIELPIYYHPSYVDSGPDFQPVPRLRKHLQHRQQLLQVERQMTQLRLASQTYAFDPCVAYNVETIRYQLEPNHIPLPEDFCAGINDAANELVNETSRLYCDDKASQVDLPESPFASL